MKWDRGDGSRDWHRWFAWYPVRLIGTDTYVWFEWIERQTHNAQGWIIPSYRVAADGPSPKEQP
jgi:hypothetical protein